MLLIEIVIFTFQDRFKKAVMEPEPEGSGSSSGSECKRLFVECKTATKHELRITMIYDSTICTYLYFRKYG
jgi:hypothetical protein